MPCLTCCHVCSGAQLVPEQHHQPRLAKLPRHALPQVIYCSIELYLMYCINLLYCIIVMILLGDSTLTSTRSARLGAELSRASKGSCHYHYHFITPFLELISALREMFHADLKFILQGVPLYF